MKIALCGSMISYQRMEEIKDKLEEIGHMVTMPKFSDIELKRLSEGETLEDLEGESAQSKIENDFIRYFYGKIGEAEGVLVINIPQKGIDGYVGGNTFLEMGFAHVLNKQLWTLYDFSKDLTYSDEIIAMQPVVLDGDLSLIREEAVIS